MKRHEFLARAQLHIEGSAAHALPGVSSSVRRERNRIHARTLDGESTGITIPSVTTAIVNVRLVLQESGAVNFAHFGTAETYDTDAFVR